jgi:hypothetical protein
LKAAYPTEIFPGCLPAVVVYDDACTLLAHLESSGDTYFKDSILCVDVFHASHCHSADDYFCVTRTNPALFKELVNGDEWVFNTSAAEQVNRWFGTFHSITLHMSMIRYVLAVVSW